MKKYFIAKDGVQKGPWTLSDISQSIQKKILTWNDYIYDDKLGDWLYLFEYPQLTEQFNQSFKRKVVKEEPKKVSADLLKDRLWYILKHEENYGPFTTLEMIQMLQSKTLHEFDFVWKQNQASWKRLADIEELGPDKIKFIYEQVHGDKSSSVGQKSFYRRRYSRAKYKCELLVHDNQSVYSAESLEISAGGACFKIDEVSFKLDAQVYLHFKPGRDVPAFNAVCKVVSVNGNKFGVAFVNISSAAKDSISKFTKKMAA